MEPEWVPVTDQLPEQELAPVTDQLPEQELAPVTDLLPLLLKWSALLLK